MNQLYVLMHRGHAVAAPDSFLSMLKMLSGIRRLTEVAPPNAGNQQQHQQVAEAEGATAYAIISNRYPKSTLNYASCSNTCSGAHFLYMVCRLAVGPVIQSSPLRSSCFFFSASSFSAFVSSRCCCWSP